MTARTKRTVESLGILCATLILFGCGGPSHQATTSNAQSKQAIVADSLMKLDSLVLTKRAKNADEAMSVARQARDLALTINTPESHATAFKILGNAWAVTNTDSAFYYYTRALSIIDSNNLTGKRAQILYNLGMLYRSTGNYRDHIRLVDSALRAAVSAGDHATQSNALNALGGFYLNTGRKEKARGLFDSAYAVATRYHLSLQTGSAMGNLARFEQDNKKSVAMQRKAISYMEGRSSSEEPIALSLINIGYRQPNADSSIAYFTRAIAMVSAGYAPEVLIGAYNNMAYCYLYKNDPITAAQCITDHALPVAIKTNNLDWQATVYDTYADILTRQGKTTEAGVNRQKSKEAKKAYEDLVAKSLSGIRD